MKKTAKLVKRRVLCFIAFLWRQLIFTPSENHVNTKMEKKKAVGKGLKEEKVFMNIESQ